MSGEERRPPTAGANVREGWEGKNGGEGRGVVGCGKGKDRAVSDCCQRSVVFLQSFHFYTFTSIHLFTHAPTLLGPRRIQRAVRDALEYTYSGMHGFTRKRTVQVYDVVICKTIIDN